MKKNLFAVFVFVFGLAFGFQTVSAQITINLPKIPKIKKDTPKAEPSTTNDDSQTKNTSVSSNGSAQEKFLQVKASNVGKIYFSNTPFGATRADSKINFSTSDYIYGRLETGGKTLREAFGFSPATKENPEYTVLFNVYVYRPTEYSSDGYQTALDAIYNYPFITFTEADLDKTYWNFDVLPEPAKTTTRVYKQMADIRYEADDSGVLALYKFLKDRAQEQNYVVGIELVKKTTDFRGNPEPEEKWLTVEGRLKLDFKGADFSKIKTDQEKMDADRVARANKEREDGDQAKIANEPLPKAWTLKSSPLLPGLTESNLKAMFLLDHPYWVQKQIIKLYAEPANSTEPTIVNNELGIPKYRYLRQSFVAFVKVVGENKCFYQRFTPAQSYAGGGTFQRGFYSILDGRINISCEKMGIK